MSDHDQLLKDYLKAALVALRDLDDTLRDYLAEGPGEADKEVISSAWRKIQEAGDAVILVEWRGRKRARQAAPSTIPTYPLSVLDEPRWPDDPEEERRFGPTVERREP